MPTMTGGQALVKSLYREGVRVVFGMPGVQTYHAMDALYDEPGIRFITVRHEQGAAYMADGYSRARGEGIGTALVVPGPGLLNASAGVGTAYAASSSMLIISGQVYRHELGKNRGALHEVENQLDVVKPITKWAHRILEVEDVPGAVHEAFRHLKTGRPRPVELEIPWDTLSDSADVELYEPEAYEPAAPDAASINEAAHVLDHASTPLIWAGGGAISSRATEALQKVAEFLQAPVVTSNEGKGALSDRHYLCLGATAWGADELDPFMGAADVVLAVGTRLSRAELPDAQRVIQIDIDPGQIATRYPNTFAVVGDARRSLEALHARLSESTAPKNSRREEIERIKTRRFAAAAELQPQTAFVQAIRAAMPEDGFLFEGVTQIGYACRVMFPVYEPGTYFTSSYFGNLGYVFPTALGAKVAQPDRAVVAISGDGGFLYNSQELATAAQHGINAVVIVFNDNAYGNVYRDQMNRFDGRAIGSKLRNPDFIKLAEAYGVRGSRVDDAAQLESALRDALAVDAPTLIEVPVGEMPSPW